jgi:hypothetical protein
MEDALMRDVADNPILSEEQRYFLLAYRDWPLNDQYYRSGGTALAAFSEVQYQLRFDRMIFLLRAAKGKVLN